MVPILLTLAGTQYRESDQLKTLLPNGSVIFCEWREAPYVSVQLILSNRDLPDQPTNYGYRHLIEHIAARSIEKHDYEVETAGGFLFASTSRDWMKFEWRVPPDKIGLAYKGIGRLIKDCGATEEVIKRESIAIAQEISLASSPEIASRVQSLRRERETGVLELLLVSPVSVGQIISGRVRGLWGQFLPAVVVLLGVWLYFANAFDQTDKSDVWEILFFGSVFLTLPVIGLYFSLHNSNFISAFLWTVFVGLLLPGIMGQVAGGFAWRVIFDLGLLEEQVVGRSGLLTTAIQILLAAHFWRQLNRNLTHRTFALDKTMT